MVNTVDDRGNRGCSEEKICLDGRTSAANLGEVVELREIKLLRKPLSGWDKGSIIFAQAFFLIACIFS